MTDHIENIARVCHEANRALCIAFGDTSQPAWNDAPEWQKESAKKGVKFHLDNPNAGPEAKTHPCMVPFHELPQEQQAKDHIFRAIVHAHAEPAPCSISLRDGGKDGEVSVAVQFYPDMKVVEGKMKPTPAQRFGAELAQAMMKGAT